MKPISLQLYTLREAAAEKNRAGPIRAHTGPYWDKPCG